MYTIEYEMQLPGEAAPWRQTLQSDEPSWAALANDGPTRVVLPPAIFTPASVVPDEVLATWDGEKVHLVEQPVSALDLMGALVVLFVVESPHTSEYREGFVPIGLLQDRSTRKRLRNHLAMHLAAMGVPAGATVVVSNPVQWQASLGSLRSRQRPGQIRTVMWNELFNAGWKANFQARVAEYGPKWILNACTAAVKAEVDAVLPPGVPVWAASHPSSKWFEKRLATRVR
ncbi:hypothetical protein HPC49_01790 [Pyxidicoccus fallax]|uniref:Uncharacterized protein n=1 Tax=Pyxidicoccus fallax TaxID=394095 RepID=A0A848L9K7_9BACT|nr:hypothetical protein [Pyxidicoccus fallax]NMO15244.1 hypothetical protein [Pyxidicoccus fallax]NPC76984.1 hypothetical protein [Pyxidicoccus fallax]